MTDKLQTTGTGFSIEDDTSSAGFIKVSEVPGSSGLSTTVPPGFLAIGESGSLIQGKTYQKINSGSGTDKWIQLINADELAAALTGNALFDPKDSVRGATSTALDATAAGAKVGKTLTANANGALVEDGVAYVNGDRILVLEGTLANATVDAGIYDVTDAGDGSNPYVLTRSADFDDSPTQEVTGGAFTFAEEGTVNGEIQWILVAVGDVDVDVDTQNWTIMNKLGGLSELQAEVDAIEVSLGTAIATDGTFAGYSGTNLLDAATSFTDADTKLDTRIGGAITANTRTNNPLNNSDSHALNLEHLDDAIGSDSQLTITTRTAGQLSLAASVYSNIDSLNAVVGDDAQLSPVARTTNPVTLANSIYQNVDQLDAAIGGDVTPQGRTFSPILNTQSANAKIDSLDEAIGADLSSLNYTSNGQSVNDNIDDLDAQIKVNSDALFNGLRRVSGTTSGGGFETVDNVLTDEVQSCVWQVVCRETANPSVYLRITITAAHNGTVSADATGTPDSADGFKNQDNSNKISGWDYKVILTGTGAGQSFNLQLDSNLGLDFEVIRTNQIL